MKKLKLAVNSAASLVLVLSTFLPVVPMFTGTVSAFTGTGAGDSSGNPFRITTCEQLQEMDDDLDAYYAIMNDIDCSGSAGWTDGDGAGFSPIGRIPGGSFTGYLDGRNHTVSGLTINRPSTGYMGLFALLNNATVKNLKLTEVSIIGYGHLGALAGQVSGTTNLSNITAEGIVDGDETYIGGLIGTLWSGTVSKVSFTGTVDGVQGIGGLVGEDLGAQISDSYANVTVTAGAVGGGLVGFMGFGGNNASIARSYAVGSLNATYKGGIVGITQGSGDLEISNSFTAVDTHGGSAIAGWDGDNPVTLINNFFDQIAHGSDDCVSGNSGVTGCTAINTDSETPQPDLFKGNDTQPPLDVWDFDAVWQTTADYPTLRDGTQDALDPASYTIVNCVQLQGMRDDLSGNYTLDADIDCSDTENWNGFEGFEPVGTDAEPFTGSLNGAGHTISGLYINREADDQGLFGVIEDGGVASLFMRGGSVQGWGNIGAVAGQLRGTGSVQQTTSDAMVIGSGRLGGLVGWVQGSAVLQYVAAMGDVSGDASVWPVVSAGGVVGQMDDDSFLVNGYATGTVTVTTAGDSYVGGVAGMVHNAAIANAYFSGTVSVPVSTLGIGAAGGLVGQMDAGAISNSFAAGEVSGPVLLGGLVGLDLNSHSGSSLYLDVSSTGQNNCFGYSDNYNESDCNKLNVADDNAEYFFGNSDNAPLDEWDFGGVWQSLADDFPIFTWQPIPGAYQLDHQYTIATCSQLQSINENPQGSYTLGTDIDCSGTIHWNGGEGFDPIGKGTEEGFMGTFDGAGHTISGLYINRPDESYVGMFAYSIQPTIHDVTLENFTIIGDSDVGALMGSLSGNSGGSVHDVTVTDVSVEGVYLVGGLIGSIEMSENEDPLYLQNNAVDGGEVVGSDAFVGGMAGRMSWGYARIVMTGNSASADVNAPNAWDVGGLIGNVEQWAYSQVTMRDLSADANVYGYALVGGLIGEFESYLDDGIEVSTIELLRASASGGVMGNISGGLIGGIAAENGMVISVRDSHADTEILADSEDSAVGGLVGGIDGDDHSVFIRQSSAEGVILNISGGAGGLVGYSDALSYIIDSFATAWVQGQSSLGGLAGSGEYIIYNSYADGLVEAQNGTVGGLVGYLYGGRVQNSFSASGVTSDPETEYVAGLIGRYDAAVVTLVGNGYDREVSGAFDCAYGNDGEDLIFNNEDDQCAMRNGENSTPNWFKNNHANAPLDEWNFDDIWQTAVGEYPGLAEQPATQAPSLVQNLEVTGDKSNLELSWDAPADDGDTDIVGYVVWVSVHGWDWWQPIGFTTDTSLNVDEGYLGDGTVYDFRVLASNETALSAAASESDSFIGTRYSVSTCDDLQAIADDTEGDYTLTSDIDCSDTVNWNEGAGFEPIPEFFGRLHGQGHTIIGLYINRPDVGGQGLFVNLYENARIEDLRLSGGSITGSTSVGAIAASMYDQSIIRRVSSDLDVTGFYYVGGLVGEARDGITIQNSYATGDVFATTGASGGLVGYAEGNDSVIEFTYATGNVTALNDEFWVDYVGGLVGVNDGANIRHSFATGVVTPAAGYDDYASGLVGYDYDDGAYLTNNYYNATDNAYCMYTADNGLTDTEDCTGIDMLAHSDYFFGNHANAPLDTWNFTSVWMTVADGYPVFRPFGTVADDDEPSDTNDHTTGGTTKTTKKATAVIAKAAQEAVETGAVDITGESDAMISLEDFTEYTEGNGKKLTLKVGQVVHFTVVRGGVTEEHTATVKEIGDGYVIVTIRSTPFDVRINLGETKAIKIGNDAALKITLRAVTDGQADLVFSKIRTPDTTTAVTGEGFNWWWVIAALGVSGAVWVAARQARRSKSDI